MVIEAAMTHSHVQCISALVAVGAVLLYWLPESPRWLIAK